MDKVATINCQGGMNLKMRAAENSSGKARMLYNYEPNRDGFRVVDGYVRAAASGPVNHSGYVRTNITQPSGTGAVKHLEIANIAGADQLLAVRESSTDAGYDSMSRSLGVNTGFVGISPGSQVTFDTGRGLYEVEFINGDNTLLNNVYAAAYGSTSFAEIYIVGLSQTGGSYASGTATGTMLVSNYNVVGSAPALQLSETLVINSIGSSTTVNSAPSFFSPSLLTGTGEIWNLSTQTTAGNVKMYSTTSGVFSGDTANGLAISTDVAVNFTDHFFISDVGVVKFTTQTIQDETSGGKARWPAQTDYASAASKYSTDSNSEAAYFVNGETGLICIDNVVAPLPEGDEATSVAVYSDRLALGFPWGDVALSGVGEPINWAAGFQYLFTTQDGLVDIQTINRGLLAIYGENQTSLLQGNHPDNWEVLPHSKEIGAIGGSIQFTTEAMFATTEGITSMSATNELGDLGFTPYSEGVDPILLPLLQSNNGVFSLIDKKKSQYRLFINDTDNTNCHVFIVAMEGGQFIGNGYAKWPIQVTAATAGTMDGYERMFIGTDDGWVMELDVYESFDETAINHAITLPYFDMGAPDTRKRWKEVKATISGDTSRLSMKMALDYSDTYSALTLAHQLGSDRSTVVTYGGSTVSAPDFPPSLLRAAMFGIGSSASIIIEGQRVTADPAHIVQSLQFSVTPRRRER